MNIQFAGFVLNRRYAQPPDFMFEKASFDKSLLLELTV